MRNLTATLCLTIITLLGSMGVSASDDWQKGLSASKSGDTATAIRIWTALAEQGDAQAQTSLAMMYGKGFGVPQSYKTALKWYRLAAEQGDANAQFMLGIYYFRGQGVFQDFVTAHMWFNLAGSRGIVDGAPLRDVIAKENMTSAQIKEAQDLARECVRKKYKGC